MVGDDGGDVVIVVMVMMVMVSAIGRINEKQRRTAQQVQPSHRLLFTTPV